MSIKVVELHHHGIRIGTTPNEVEQARNFYTDVLGLATDSGRPNVPGIPGILDVCGAGGTDLTNSFDGGGGDVAHGS